MNIRNVLRVLPLVLTLGAARLDGAERDLGVLPVGADGHRLNLDFETGDLRDWTARGDAFNGQPIRGDTVAARRSDMKSRHQGDFWVGTFERAGDRPRGTLSSAPFRLAMPFARFLIAGGADDSTRLEIVLADTGRVIHRVSGDGSEDLKPVAVDLSAHEGKTVFLRLVDDAGGGWGHLNFDDFKLWPEKPTAPTRPSLPAPDAFAHEGLPPAEAAAAMTLPEGFKATLFAGEPDVAQPIAFTIDDRGRLWVAEAYSYPIRLPDAQAHDRILIFEDADGDGKFDGRKVFADHLNLVSGIEVGFGGVWVGAAPRLLYFPDQDGDDQPDGPPQVLLDGWGHQDTHETLNSFNWGPDGWLYGCHGIFTHSRVGKPGAPDADRVPINAGIWRYHPTRHEFEVFAHGTSNPWGVDFDPNGRAFLTSCVIPHLYHVIQGARYERQAGQHFNTFTYDDIKTIADHRHYLGANPHGGNGRSDLAGGGHAHAGALIYQGGAWPAAYRGGILMNNIHGARLNHDRLVPSGSGFVGRHAPDFLLANDRASQIVSLRTGPDGQLYMIDWYDLNQCHRADPTVHDRTNGRIFRVAHADAPPMERGIDAKAISSLELTRKLSHPNDWHVRHARRLLQERAPTMDAAEVAVVRKALEALAFGEETVPVRLNALWALHASTWLDEPMLRKALGDRVEQIRGWAVLLATERGTPSDAVSRRLAELAREDTSPVVRLDLASAAGRLPVAKRWEIVEGLAGHSEDAGDQNVPLMVWYAAEPLARVDARRVLELAVRAKLPNLLPFMVRRVAAIGDAESLALLLDAARNAPDPRAKLAVLDALNESLKGRRKVDMPGNWTRVSQSLREVGDSRINSLADALALTFGDPTALGVLRGVLADSSATIDQRGAALTALLKAQDPALPPLLRSLLSTPELRGRSIRALAAFDDPDAPEAILRAYPGLTPDERRDALNTLASRVGSARILLAAVGSNRLPRADISADIVRQLRNHKDAETDAALTRVWGTARETTADKAQAIDGYRRMIRAPRAPGPDLELGRAMFAKTCQQCHAIFGVGAKIGPELTGSNRADLDYILANVLDPSALIGKDYLAHVVATADGRVLTGIIKAEDRDALALQTANEVVVIPLAEVEARRPSEQSMMPDDLWKPLSDHEVRSLVAYLASPVQVPMLATVENASGFFNGQDLRGWSGDPGLWSVENGEIVGKTTGLRRNAFLRSDLTAEDFRLTLEIKLVNNEGNSGIQFRSASGTDGEVKGYQADAGPGWWGKLYEEHGRGLLWDHSGEAHLKPGDWNEYQIIAEGPRARTFLNGQPCVDLTDPDGARRGIFAIQLHSGGATEVRLRNLRLEPLTTTPR